MIYEIPITERYIKPYIEQSVNYKTKYEQRKAEFSEKNMKNIDDNFVEFFSWTPIPYKCLLKIGNIFKEKDINIVVDPCAGTGYHAFLFSEILKLKSIAFDIQPETYKNEWYPVKYGNCKKSSYLMCYNQILILSWIDYNALCEDMLKVYQPKYIMLIGIYYRCLYSKNLYDKFCANHKIIEEITLKPYYANDKENDCEKITIFDLN